MVKGTMIEHAHDFLTRTKALSVYCGGIVDADCARIPWEETLVNIGEVDYTVYTRSIYDKGVALHVMSDGKMVTDLMYVLDKHYGTGEWYDLGPVYLCNAVVFSGFNMGLEVLNYMFPFWYKNIANMSGEGKYVAVQKMAGRNGSVYKYTGKEVHGACMANDFYGLVPLHGGVVETGHGSYAFDDLYFAWMEDSAM